MNDKDYHIYNYIYYIYDNGYCNDSEQYITTSSVAYYSWYADQICYSCMHIYSKLIIKVAIASYSIMHKATKFAC